MAGVTAATGRRPGRRGRQSEKGVVAAYLAVAVLAAFVALPSVLRPPQQEQQTGAAFSPDAPPDQNQQSIFNAFKGASSGTPSGVDEATGGDEDLPPSTTTTVPPPQLRPNACPYGYGNPTRQIESVYSPPCATVFVGDNGGATSKGVTADSIKVCFLMSLTGTTGDGPINATAQPGESANHRTYRVWRDYFNSRMQFYGRQVQFQYVASDSTNGQRGNAQNRARAQKAANQNCFAAIQETDPEEIEELVRHKIVTYTLAQVPEKYYAPKDPYLWSFTPAGSQMVRMGVEYACKKLAGGNPIYTKHPTRPQGFESRPRKFGIINYNPPAYGDAGAEAARMMKQQCGVDAMVVNYELEEGSSAGPAGLSSAITQMKAADVSTIFFLGDLLIGAPVFSQSATQQDYFPEWFLPGFGGVDTGHIARLYDQAQWEHAFGYSFYEIPQPDSETECYKAYREIDPDNNPNDNMCIYMWGHMVQLMSGLQKAGPNLTPETFKKGLLETPQLPPDPPWHMAGGYGPNDHTFPDWASEIWWDRNALGSDGQTGTYRFPQKGKRYTYGLWESKDNGLFKEGIALASEL